MSATITELVREALSTWAAGLSYGLTPTVSAEAPAPGAKPALPTLVCWFAEIEPWQGAPARQVLDVDDAGATADLWGYSEAEVRFVFRCGSLEDAALARDGFLHAALYSAVRSAGRSHESAVVPLTITLGDVAEKGSLYLTGRRTLAEPALTQVRDLWLVTHFARLIWPEISLDPQATGLMAISVTVDGVTVHLSSGADPIQATADI